MGTDRRKRPARRGFTLIELLVVVLIVSIIGVATIKVAIFDQGGRHVSEAARLLQAAIVGARDAAFRANAPRGIRLLPDPVFNGQTGGALAANRMISIETAPDYNTGLVSVSSNGAGSFLVIFESMVTPVTNTSAGTTTTVQVPNEPTSWYWNVRQGDKIRFGDSGRYYTVAGPNLSGAYVPDPNNAGQYLPYNVERYVNFGAPGYVMDSTGASVQNDPNPLNYYDSNLQPKGTHFPEFLQVVNGQDDDGDGWVDEGFDGIDNDNDGIIDPAFNGIDDDGVNGVDDLGELTYNNGGEYEPEAFIGSEFNSLNIPGVTTDKVYAIVRRPIVSEGAREVALPQGVVIDLTTWNATGARNAAGRAPTLPERSRLPIDPYSHFVDIMISPDGQVMTAGAGQSAGSLAGGTANFPTSNMPFYHFWIAEREDVYDPMFGMTSTVAKGTGGTNATLTNVQVPKANPSYGSTPPHTYLLPMPQGAVGTWLNPTNGAATSVPYTAYDASGNVSPNGPYLKGDSRLVTLFVKTGHVLTYEIGLSDFDPTDTNQPYMQAQFGIREAK